MLNPQNNQDLVKRINLLLDNELSKDAERALLNEIKTNPAYRDLLQKEKSFREFIKSRIHRRKVSPSLVQSIKDNLKVVS
jgi:hypothetical protein